MDTSRIMPGHHPNSLAALFRCQVRAPFQRKCAKCNRIALRGRLWCNAHASHAKPPSPAYGRAERRLLVGMHKLGLLPADLIATPVWQGLAMLPTRIRSPLRLRLVLIWHKRETEGLAFAQVWREAMRAPIECAPNERGRPADVT